MSTRPDLATSEERKCIKQLRIRISRLCTEYKDVHLSWQLMNEDVQCLKFLRARQCVLDDVVLMISESLAWRRKDNVDVVYKEQFPFIRAMKAMSPGAFHKFDKLGRAIYMEKTGLLDLGEMTRLTDMDTLVRLHVGLNEYIAHYLNQEASNRAGYPIFQALNIVDLEGLSSKVISQDVMTYIKLVSKIDSDNYPESLGQFFLINSPFIFTAAWRVIKGFLDPKTVKKFQIFGRSGYKEALLEVIDAENLPVEYGGTCSCGSGTPTDGCFTSSEQELDYLRYCEADDYTPPYVGKIQAIQDEKEAAARRKLGLKKEKPKKKKGVERTRYAERKAKAPTVNLASDTWSLFGDMHKTTDNENEDGDEGESVPPLPQFKQQKVVRGKRKSLFTKAGRQAAREQAAKQQLLEERQAKKAEAAAALAAEKQRLVQKKLQKKNKKKKKKLEGEDSESSSSDDDFHFHRKASFISLAPPRRT